MLDLAPHIHLWWGEGFDNTAVHFFKSIFSQYGIQVDLVAVDESSAALAESYGLSPTISVADAHALSHSNCRAVVFPCTATELLRRVTVSLLVETIQTLYPSAETLLVARPSVVSLFPQPRRVQASLEEPSLDQWEAFAIALSHRLNGEPAVAATSPKIVVPDFQSNLPKPPPTKPNGAQPTGTYSDEPDCHEVPRDFRHHRKVITDRTPPYFDLDDA